MKLPKGRMLLHYEILGPLGAGGMGVVYRARDTRLDRDVALKVLPEALVGDESHLARFEREAKLLAALNHPNVASIYGVDHVDGISFLSLELVPGETLRDRITRGSLSVEETVRVAREIASGLEAAHQGGIVHRDLKPANIIIRPDGHVKILDFGLARQTDVTGDSVAVQLTQQYQVLGTAGYLSPEQARGEVADQRADVWAFGCVLYECLAGRKVFGGETMGESIQAMFEREPDLEALPPKTPHALRVLISRCLSKRSAERLRDIGDVRILLEGAVDRSISMVSGPIVITQRAKSPRLLIAGLAAAVLVAGTLGFLLWRGTPGGAAAPAATGTRTLAMPLGSELGWRQTSAALSKLGRGSPLLAISPDGPRVAYCAKKGDHSLIYVHVPGEAAARDLGEDTARARAPFFSPSGTQVGFLAGDNIIKAVSVDGGAAQEIHDLSSPSPNFSACWIGDDIVYATRKGLRRVPRKGGEPEVLTNPADVPEEIEHLDPSPLGDGEHVLFTAALGTKSRVAMVSLRTKKWRTVLPDGGTARYVDGWLVYAQAGGLQRVRFDPKNPDERGLPEPLQDYVFSTPCAGGGAAITHFDLARDGTLVYAPAPEQGTEGEAYWVDRNTQGVGSLIERGAGSWGHPRLADSDRRFALDILEDSGAKDVWVYVSGQRFIGNQTHDGMSVMSAWTPAGVLSVRSTHESVVRDVSAAGDRKLFPEFDGVLYADSWTSDGKTLVLTRKIGTEISELWTFTRGDEAPRRLFESKERARFGRLSPDDRWLAYVQDVGPEPEVWVRAFDLAGEPVKVSQHGGGAPVWSKDGRELFYREADGTMLAATFTTDGGFQVTDQTPLFKSNFPRDYDADPDGHQHYDVSEDGRRFLMIKNSYSAPNRVHVVPGALHKPGR